MQGHWYGGLSGKDNRLEFPAPLWFRWIRMTATATLYTPFGFVVAADGRQLWQHKPTRDRAACESESDTVQKIFEIADRDASLAYVIRGDTVNRDRSFDVGIELRKQINLLHAEDFTNCRQYLQTVSVNLERTVETAREEQRIDGYLTTEIEFVGYFRGDPFCIEVQFRPFRDPRTGSLFEITRRDLYPGFYFVAGSLLIANLVAHGDPRFSPFCKPIDHEMHEMTLQEAADLANGYIKACASPLGLQIDPENCSKIGGHIHIATLTPENGFEWVVGYEPRSSSQ